MTRHLIAWLAALAVLFGLVALVPAADCRRVVVAPQVVTPTVVTPAVTVTTTGYLVTPSVVTPAVTVTTTGYLVTPSVTYPVVGATYGGDVAGEVRALREELAKLRAALTAPASGGLAKPAQMPAADGPDSKMVQAVQSCQKCHAGANPKGSLNLAADHLGKVTREQWKEAFLRTSLPPEDPMAMPPKGPAVSDEALATIADKAKGK